MEAYTPEPQVEEKSWKQQVMTVTPFSKYLALALFIVLPFLGGWVGYTFAPEKIVEVERINSSNGPLTERTDQNVLRNLKESEGSAISDAKILPLPDAVMARLEAERSFPSETFSVVDYSPMVWEDDCLGFNDLSAQEDGCVQGEIEGYEIWISYKIRSSGYEQWRVSNDGTKWGTGGEIPLQYLDRSGEHIKVTDKPALDCATIATELEPEEYPSDVLDTSLWQSCESRDLGITFKYPITLDSLDDYPQTVHYDMELVQTLEKPQVWVAKASADGQSIGFGTPASMPGGYIWGISKYKNLDIETAIARQGRQFEDRKEIRETILLGGKSAVLVTVTTEEYENWISQMVYVQDENGLLVVSNGATGESLYLEAFKLFYQSIDFTDS